MCTTTINKATGNSHHTNKTNKIVKGMASNIVKHVYLLFRIYLDKLIDLVFGFYWENKRQPIPALEKRHHILTESAVSLANKIRNKELTSEELVNACIERIKSVNPVLNAVTDERFEDALKEAQEVDKQIAKGLPDDDFDKRPFLEPPTLVGIVHQGQVRLALTLKVLLRQLHPKVPSLSFPRASLAREQSDLRAGVPFTTKESCAVEGMLNTLGLVSRRHTRAHVDAEAVRLLRAAGAIPVAITNVPEVNKWQECRNMLFGQTNNPYHTGRTTGGSSGGEAALCAALATPIALCSDIGGSTRMPAYYCGLFGLNPTAGYTNLRGLALRSGEAETMAAISFVSRHCSDLAPLTKVVAGEKAAQLGFDKHVDLKNIKYYFVETAQDLRVSPLSAEVRQTMKKVVSKLTEQASSTDKAPKPYYHEGFNHMFVLWRYWMTREADSFPKLMANNQGEAKAVLELPKKLVGLSKHTMAGILKLIDEQILPPVDKTWAENLTKELSDDLVSTLGADGVLLFPSAPTTAPYHYSLLLRPFHFAHWAIFNVLKLPAAQVPLGLDSAGLPLGIQVVAAPRQEGLCLAVAELLGREFGGYVPPCTVF